MAVNNTLITQAIKSQSNIVILNPWTVPLFDGLHQIIQTARLTGLPSSGTSYHGTVEDPRKLSYLQHLNVWPTVVVAEVAVPAGRLSATYLPSRDPVNGIHYILTYHVR